MPQYEALQIRSRTNGFLSTGCFAWLCYKRWELSLGVLGGFKVLQVVDLLILELFCRLFFIKFAELLNKKKI